MPFRSWDWLATWWKHYGDASSAMRRIENFIVLAVYADARRCARATVRGSSLGIAPWYLDRTAIQGNVLRWLGSGEVCTDHLSLICRPEDADQVADGSGRGAHRRNATIGIGSI